MVNFLSALAFAGLIAAQFLSVVLLLARNVATIHFQAHAIEKKAGVPARWTAKAFLEPFNVSTDLFGLQRTQTTAKSAGAPGWRASDIALNKTVFLLMQRSKDGRK